MKEIIKVQNAEFTEYEDLLMERDRLRKEAHLLRLSYMAEFGNLITQLFKTKIKCIEKKKTLAFCQAAQNRGEHVNQDEINAYLTQEMKEYYRQLEKMIAENEAAHSMERISAGKFNLIKKLYHKLAKQIHPDINPETVKNPELMKLWHMVTVSYNANNLEDLQEAEFLISRLLEKNGISAAEIEIPDISEKIKQVQEDILKIKSTDPYQYKYLLRDAEAVSRKNEALQKELKEFTDYAAELDLLLDAIMNGGGTSPCQLN